jgi:predicted nucleotidyltransferase
MNIFLEEHLEILEFLIKHKVRFLLIGGYAVIIHGYRRTTGDMDLWLEPTNENKLLFINALRDLNFEDEALEHIQSLDFREPQVLMFGEQPQRIDFLTKINQVTFDEAFDNQLSTEFEGLQLPVINLRELILSKINTGRPKDAADIDELQRIARNKKND